MKVDLPFLKQIAQAMKERLNEAEQAYRALDDNLHAISIADWDDQKRKDFVKTTSEMKVEVSKTIFDLKEYISFLNVKIAELENK